jgi:hypothetical protein
MPTLAAVSLRFIVFSGNRVGISFGLEQQLHDTLVPTYGGIPRRCPTEVIPRSDIGFRLEQQLNDALVHTPNGAKKWRLTYEFFKSIWAL